MARKKKTDKIDPESTKSTVEGFVGGLALPLDRAMKDGTKLRTALSQHIKAVFDKERENQRKLEDKIAAWEKQYYGIKEPKSFPYPNASNVSVPITRSSADTIFVRVWDAIFNKSTVWTVRARKPEYIELAKQVEEGLDWFQRNILKLKQKLLSPLLQGIKIGTGIGKLVYEDRKRVVYRYATPDEEKDPEIHKYPSGDGGPKLVKFVDSVYQGPNFYPVSREDFIISTDATEINDAYFVGHRKYYTKAQLRAKARQGLFDQEAVDRLTAPDAFDEVKKARAENENKTLDKIQYSEPYEVWELWTKYDVDEDGEEDELMVVLHPSSGEVLRGIYTPLFSGKRPYNKFVFYPKEFAFDGEGVVQILEHLQATLDTMTNQMIDRVTQINAPILFKHEAAGLTELKYLTPGGVYTTEIKPDEAIYEFKFSDQTVSLANEIGWILSMMDRAVGITPIALGISTAERPVAKDTFAQQEETNKKFKYGTDNVRDCLSELGYDILEMLAQYQPTFVYKSKGADGAMEPRTVQFPVEYIRDAFEIELAASSELWNQGVRKDVFMAVYTLLSDYLTKIGGMAQALTSPQVPSEFKKVLLTAGDISAKIMDKILENFPDLKDSDSLILNLRASVDEQKVLMESADIIAQQQQMQQAQQGQGGPPPEQMSPQGDMGGGMSPEQMLVPGA